ncbi:MAG: exonuclease domain-containing protein, partial [Chloroflexota bacterium]
MQYPFVSLDLETTGLDPETDQITEIGAVKFLGDDVIGTFETLVNPKQPIPYFIQVLTGIRPQEVDKAPSFSAIAEDLVSFIGLCPVVGQNVSFDLEFLSAKGIRLLNPVYDTYELSNILLPSLPEHGLSYLARLLEVSTHPCHRALADAVAAKDVFLALLAKASQLSPAILGELNQLTARLDWPLRHLFLSLEESKANTEPAPSKRRPLRQEAGEFKLASSARSEPLVPASPKVLIDTNQLTELLTTALPQQFPGFEYRPEQVRMLQAVTEALNQDTHLLVEAGTGTGKSLAYLLPCLRFASQNNTPVVISTNTINLQEQLMSKDIPDLADVLNRDGAMSSLGVVQLKGRSNYLCLRRLALLRRSQSLSLDDAKLLIRISVWLDSTTTGDKAELNLNGNENVVWNKTCSQANSCLVARCRYHEEGTCFFYRARWAAEGAHIIVVNHALLLSDMVSGAKVLP